MTSNRRSALRGAGMGDWWSDLVFNLNPSNSSIHQAIVTPVADSIYGIPLGSISNTTQQGIQDLLTGTYSAGDIQTMMQNGGKMPPTIAPAASQPSSAAAAGQVLLSDKKPFPILPVAGGLAVAGLGVWWLLSRPSAGATS